MEVDKIMQRIPAIRPSGEDTPAQAILQKVKKSLGVVPNLLATLAQSPAAAQAYLGFSQALAGGALDPMIREQIALAVGEANACSYCVSAHSALGARSGLSQAEIEGARRGISSDAKAAAALDFVLALVAERGRVSDGAVDALRQRGFSDGEIVEIVAHVAMNLFTNYFNHVAATEIDFPLAKPLS